MGSKLQGSIIISVGRCHGPGGGWEGRKVGGKCWLCLRESQEDPGPQPSVARTHQEYVVEADREFLQNPESASSAGTTGSEEPGPQPEQERDREREGQGKPWALEADRPAESCSATSMLCDPRQVIRLTEHPPIRS